MKSLRKNSYFDSFRKKIKHWANQNRFIEDESMKLHIQNDFYDILDSHVVENLSTKSFIYDEIVGLTSTLFGTANPIAGGGISLTSPLAKHLYSTRKNEFLMFYYKLKSL